MANKTNVEINGNKYFEINAVIGRNPDGTYKRKKFRGKNKKEAEQKKDEFLRGIDQGLSADYKEMSIEQLMRIWLFDVVKQYAAYATFDRYMIVFNHYVIPSPLRKMKVYEIKPLTLQRYYNDMAENGYTSSIIFNLNKLLKTFFNYALRQDYILKNPCFGLIIPKTDKTDDTDNPLEVDPFTDEEITKLLLATADWFKPIVQFGLSTGLRRGEIIGLRVRDVDLENMMVYVRQALKNVKKYDSDGNHEYITVIEQTKTKNSVRDVDLPPNMQRIIRAHIAAQKEKHLALGIPFNDDSLFFTTSEGTPFDSRNITKAWERVAKRADVRYRCFHNLRHTYASRLFAAGVPLKTVSILLGHSNIAITANVYISVMPKEKKSAAESLNYRF